MGIRYLTVTTSPYGEPRVLGSDTRVVIDGPAFAYHIIGVCSPKHGPTSPFAQPSYELLGSTAVAWLDELERQGPQVAAIYFDGHLPRDKLAERLDRFRGVSRQLNNFFLATPHGVAESESRTSPVDRNKLFSSSSNRPSWAAGTLPPPPLAVQAICDALRQSDRYGDLTQLVPEEADCYCADSVRIHGGGVVLTSDSDLLVFELGEEGSVVFLKDIDLGGAATKSDGLHVQRSYSPAKMAKRLGLPAKYGVSALAFELYLDSYLPEGKLLENARQATAIKESPGAYLTFMEPYTLFPLESGPRTAVTPAELCNMDSRLSELAVQCVNLSSPESDSGNPTESSGSERDGSPLRIFLPNLVDAWTRTSAWEMGSSIRELAYRILRLGLPKQPAEVREYRRLTTAASSGGTCVSLPAVDAADGVAKSCAELMAQISKIRDPLTQNQKDEDSSSDLVWAVLSMHQDIQQSQDSGKESLVLHLLSHSTDRDGAIRDCGTWDVLHLLAQLQATLYSLRMLKQVLDFAASRAARKNADGDGKPPFPAALEELSTLLSYHLPPITAYCSVHDIKDLPRRLKEAGGLELLRDLAGLKEPIKFGADAARLAKKKRKRSAQTEQKGAGSKPGPRPAAKPRNMFSLLGALGTE
ncbi:hypothetical protein MAPG_04995 [Magnaporthiopsis poae ATCC 64411]|uniref:Asteroid domain-containing protein n=1 Tax=Magnaporthiopsis poae (strain ATCC 64411 / 73-15) TaxID=644358 RepID=A0A0C4DY84_MAGP6|nr:hypothetical protein MAPG_04995 [Magnaporthiopsis poae ATCC 64411]